MQRLVPCLMFVGDRCGSAEEAIGLYVSTFERARIISIERYGPEHEGERGIRHARFEIAGQEVAALDSAGPHHFSFTPAVSLIVECGSVDELDAAWSRLSDGGEVLMALQAYDFSPKFGWLQDRFGVSWQLTLSPSLSA